MKKIPSFTVDHIRLLRGIYVSRKDTVGNEIVTTFDIRMKEPNREPCPNLDREARGHIFHRTAVGCWERSCLSETWAARGSRVHDQNRCRHDLLSRREPRGSGAGGHRADRTQDPGTPANRLHRIDLDGGCFLGQGGDKTELYFR